MASMPRVAEQMATYSSFYIRKICVTPVIPSDFSGVLKSTVFGGQLPTAYFKNSPGDKDATVQAISLAAASNYLKFDSSTSQLMQSF